MSWPIKNKSELYYYFLLCKNVVRILWRPANRNECRFGYHCRRQASNCCNLQRGSRNKSISQLFYNFIINPSTAASSNPFWRGSWGWGVFIYGNHAARQENGSSWLGCLCDVYFASKKSSKREFFVPTGTHLAGKLLITFLFQQLYPYGRRCAPIFFKLCASLITFCLLVFCVFHSNLSTMAAAGGIWRRQLTNGSIQWL